MAEALITRLKATTDYYEILQVSRSATEKELKLSYRKKALLLHPDRCKLPDAKDAFQKLSNAHMCLTDPEKRRRYDVSGTDSNTPNPFEGAGGNPFAGFSSSGGGIPPDLFEHIFRAAQGQGGMGGMGGMPGTTFRFSTAGIPTGGGFPGNVHFNFGQPRRRRTATATTTREGRRRGQEAQGQAQQAGAIPGELPANIRNSWLYKSAQAMLGESVGPVVQVLGFIGILLMLFVFTRVITQHFLPVVLCLFFSGSTGMRALVGALFFFQNMFDRHGNLTFNPVVGALAMYAFAGLALQGNANIVWTVKTVAVVLVVLFSLLGY